MMRCLLLPVTIALFAKTAAAGLGWTLDECKKHYGEPTSTKTHALGILECTFSVKDFAIELETDQQGKVGYITYNRSSIDSELATQLMQQNAPKATWKKDSTNESSNSELSLPGAKEIWWGSENGSQKYLALLFKDVPLITGTSGDSLAIGTFEFHVLKEASKKEEAKDQASGL
jgi:hypothetical protein